jgi:branched-chain amino acid transport system ATP-binding protein
MLQIVDLNAGFGGKPVIERLSLEFAQGESIALIGPNGCGKSTLLRAVMAQVPQRRGSITFRGQELVRLRTDQIVRLGIGHLRQTRNVFPGLTVAENLAMAAMTGNGQPRDSAELTDAFENLRGRQGVRAGLLSGGQRQALAMAMTLMRKSSLILLDEPFAGVTPAGSLQILAFLERLRQSEGFTLLIVEHRLKLLQPHVSRVVIMARGEIVHDTLDTSILQDRHRLEKHYQL